MVPLKVYHFWKFISAVNSLAYCGNVETTGTCRCSNHLVTPADARYQCLEPAPGECNFANFVTWLQCTGRTEKTGSHWRKKAIWGHRKKRERWGDMTKLHSQALVLSFQPCFLFAARVFIWEARVLPHPDPMRTTVISTMETLCPLWMTDLSTQATRDPPPHLPQCPTHYTRVKNNWTA